MTVRLKRYRDLLKAYLQPQWRSVSLLTALMLLSIGLRLVGPQILGAFIDAVQAGEPVRDLLQNAAAFLAAATAGQAVALVVTYLAGNVGWRATNSLRTDLAAHCLALDMGFHKSHTPGELIERIDGDVGMLAEFFSEMVVEFLGNSLLSVGVLVALHLVDWRVGLVGAAYTALVVLAIRALRERTTEAWKSNRDGETALFGFLGEHLYGMADIRGNGAEAFVMTRLHHLMNAVAAGRLRAVVMRSLQTNLAALVFAVAQVAALALSAWLLTRGETTLGNVFLTLNYIALLKDPVSRIQRHAGDLQRATAGIQRISALLEARPAIASNATAAPAAGAAAVAFQHVSFHYDDAPSAQDASLDGVPDDGWALQDISFTLPPGHVLGLLGRTGSGKTTVTRLLFRLYDPDEGRILLGGTDLRNMPLDALRRRIGLVTQEVQLFRASVRDNLTLFNSEIPDAHLLTALESLGLASWIASLPEGLDTRLQPGSEGLSAGEAQLLDLARVFLKDPDLIILDEASARIDPATERLLDTAISRLIEGRTAIIVAHRLSTVARAGDIMVMDHGRIAEFGVREVLAADPHSRFHHLLETGLQEVLT
ncbi:MAG: ABC transporter ATP-binding protein [Anaerolineae bacterium]|nr:ABC transporter ATP-binding protein [Anaerolineae bacterium]